MHYPSPYLAMSNNPVSFTDPTGLWDFDENDGDYDFNFTNSNDSYKPKPKIKNIKNADPKKYSKIEKKRFTFGIYSGETFLNTFELPDNSSGTEVLDVHGKKRSVGSAYGEKAGRYISSTKNWAKGLKAGKGELSGTDKFGYGLNAAGIANGAKTEIIDYAVRTSSTKVGIRAELQVLGKTGTRYLSAAKGLGFMAGAAGVAVTGIDAYNKGEWQNHHTADVLIGLGSLYLLTGPIGWTAGGGYFLLDVGVKSYNGKSITENLFDKP